MAKRIQTTALVIGLWLTSGAAVFAYSAQIRAEQALTEGRPVVALEFADAILVQSPDSYDALFVKALALKDLEKYEDAANVAQAAHSAAETDAQRLAAARLASAMRFNAGQFTRAEWWLRRAANNTQSPEEADLVYREYQLVRRANPLTANLKFGLAPVSNFNGGSESPTITFEGLGEFTLAPDQQALSGTEYTLDLRADYRLSRSEHQQTTLGAYLYGRTYTPSSSAKRDVPGIDGDDYSLGVVEVSLTHERLIWADLGPSQGTLTVGRLWYGGDPYWNYRRLALAQGVRLDEAQGLSFSASTERQDGIEGRHAETDIHTLGVSWSKTLQKGDGVGLSLRKKVYLTQAFESSFDEYETEASYRLARPVLGVQWSASLGIGYADYEAFFASLNGRQDNYVFGSLRAVWTDVSYFGFSPQFDLTLEERDSTVDRYDRSIAQIRVGVASNF